MASIAHWRDGCLTTRPRDGSTSWFPNWNSSSMQAGVRSASARLASRQEQAAIDLLARLLRFLDQAARSLCSSASGSTGASRAARHIRQTQKNRPKAVFLWRCRGFDSRYVNALLRRSCSQPPPWLIYPAPARSVKSKSCFRIRNLRSVARAPHGRPADNSHPIAPNSAKAAQRARCCRQRQSNTLSLLSNQVWMICHLSRPFERKSNNGDRASCSSKKNFSVSLPVGPPVSRDCVCTQRSHFRTISVLTSLCLISVRPP